MQAINNYITRLMTLSSQVRAMIQQYTDHLQAPIVSCKVQGCVTLRCTTIGYLQSNKLPALNVITANSL